MSLDLQIILTFIVGALEVVLGIWLLVNTQKSDIRNSYALFIFSIAAWVLTNAITLIIEDPKWTDIVNRSIFAAAVLIPASFVYFTHVFPYKLSPIRKMYAWVVVVVTAFQIALFFLTNLVVASTNLDPFRSPNFGSLYVLHALLFILLWVWGLINLLKHYRGSDGMHRWQMSYLILGILISSIFAITLSFFVPLYQGGAPGYSPLWAPLSSAIWLGFTTFVVLKGSGSTIRMKKM